MGALDESMNLKSPEKVKLGVEISSGKAVSPNKATGHAKTFALGIQGPFLEMVFHETTVLEWSFFTRQEQKAGTP